MRFKSKVAWAWCENQIINSSFSCILSDLKLRGFPRRVIYSGESVVFLTAVKVRDIVSREAGPVFTEQKEFSTIPSPCVSVWPAAPALAWFGVDERMECVAPSVVVWGSPLARSLRQPPPWQPTAALAEAPTRCHHTELSVEECIRPALNTPPLFFFTRGEDTPKHLLCVQPSHFLARLLPLGCPAMTF